MQKAIQIIIESCGWKDFAGSFCSSLTSGDFPLIGTTLSPITTGPLNLKGPKRVEGNRMCVALCEGNMEAWAPASAPTSHL